MLFQAYERDIHTDRLEITQENKKEVDRKIHEYLGVEYKNCSQTWKLIKERRAENPEQFISDLKTALKV